MVGQSVSHYRIVDQLGQGGMGVVYRAQDIRLDRQVALKFFPPNLAGDGEAMKRFEREARAASALDHPNICTVYEVDEADDGRTFIAMACYDGLTLKQRIAVGPLPFDEVLRVGEQIAAGLSEAHRKGIVHRDLKPANIIITPDGVVKIVDFGLALLTGESRITRADATAGTPSYMAPEQVRGDDADHRADLWALGALLYEMATGRPAFSGDYMEAVLYQIVHSEPPGVAELDLRLRHVVERCLKKNPRDRFQSADEVRTALLSPEPDLLPFQPSAERRWLTWSAVAAGVAVVVVLASIGAVPTAALFGWLAPEAGLEELHVAVLPLRVIGSSPQSDAYARGLGEVITSNLTRLDPYAETSFWVVPTSEILRREVTSADQARRLFGANLVLDGSVQQTGRSVRLTLNLTDTKRLRQVATWTGDFSDESAISVQDHAALQAAQMLQLNVPSGAREDITRGGTADLGANEFYVQGRGYLQRYDEIDNIETAISLFHRAIAKDSAFVLATASLAEAHWRMYEATKNPVHADSALAYGRRAESRRNLPAQVYTSLGFVYAGTGRAERALETFGTALAIEPNSADAHRGRAHALAALDRPLEAEASYLEAIRRKPDFWAGYHDLGVFYYRQGDFEKASEQFRRETELTPDNAFAHVNLGALYFYMEQWQDAEQYLRQAIALEPQYRAFSNLGTLYFHQQRFAEAAEMYQRALQIESHDYSVWAYLATAYRFSDQPDESIRALQRALELAQQRLDVVPGDASTMASIAMYQAMLGNREEAVRLLEQVTSESDTDIWLAYQMGQTYELLGRRADALQWINFAVENGLRPFYPQHNVWLESLRADPGFALNTTHR